MRVTYSNYEGMIHCFWWLMGVLDGATRLHEEIATEVRSALHERAPRSSGAALSPQAPVNPARV